MSHTQMEYSRNHGKHCQNEKFWENNNSISTCSPPDQGIPMRDQNHGHFLLEDSSQVHCEAQEVVVGNQSNKGNLDPTIEQGYSPQNESTQPPIMSSFSNMSVIRDYLFIDLPFEDIAGTSNLRMNEIVNHLEKTQAPSIENQT